MRAAPDLRSTRCGWLWLVPSGKMRMLPPARSHAATSSNTRSLEPPCLVGSSVRRTMRTESTTPRRNAKPGTFHSVLLATGEMSHPEVTKTRIGSRIAFTWFDTKRRPRTSRDGTSPTTSTSRKYAGTIRRRKTQVTPRRSAPTVRI